MGGGRGRGVGWCLSPIYPFHFLCGDGKRGGGIYHGLLFKYIPFLKIYESSPPTDKKTNNYNNDIINNEF